MAEQVLGIITPHPPIMVEEVGGRRAAATAQSAEALYAASRLLAAYNPETVVIMSPHAPIARDAFVIDASDRYAGDFSGFGAPQLRFSPRGDPALAHSIIAEAEAESLPVMSRSMSSSLQPGALDHGVLVPLAFLDREGRYPIVVVSLSFLPLERHRAFGAAIRRAVGLIGRKVAFIASGDCSHRLTPDAPAGYSPRAQEFDDSLVRLLTAGDYRSLENLDPSLVQVAGECGLRSFVTLGGFLEGTRAETRVLSYEGPWGVGYVTGVAGTADVLAELQTPAVGAKGGIAGAVESPPVALARETIEAYVRDGRTIDPPQDAGELGEPHGVFVSLHLDGRLRGCIGTIMPTQPTLAAEIVNNAIQAATADPRFPPLAADELERLDISVDVLHAPEPATLADLDPSAYGVVVSCGWRRGLLLPDLEGVDTVDDQVSIACRKAGIGPHETIELERFCVDRYH